MTHVASSWGWLTRHDPGLVVVRRAARVTLVACLAFYVCRYVPGQRQHGALRPLRGRRTRRAVAASGEPRRAGADAARRASGRLGAGDARHAAVGQHGHGRRGHVRARLRGELRGRRRPTPGRHRRGHAAAVHPAVLPAVRPRVAGLAARRADARRGATGRRRGHAVARPEARAVHGQARRRRRRARGVPRRGRRHVVGPPGRPGPARGAAARGDGRGGGAAALAASAHRAARLGRATGPRADRPRPGPPGCCSAARSTSPSSTTTTPSRSRPRRRCSDRRPRAPRPPPRGCAALGTTGRTRCPTPTGSRPRSSSSAPRAPPSRPTACRPSGCGWAPSPWASASGRRRWWRPSAWRRALRSRRTTRPSRPQPGPLWFAYRSTPWLWWHRLREHLTPALGVLPGRAAARGRAGRGPAARRGLRPLARLLGAADRAHPPAHVRGRHPLGAAARHRRHGRGLGRGGGAPRCRRAAVPCTPSCCPSSCWSGSRRVRCSAPAGRRRCSRW